MNDEYKIGQRVIVKTNGGYFGVANICEISIKKLPERSTIKLRVMNFEEYYYEEDIFTTFEEAKKAVIKMYEEDFVVLKEEFERDE